MVWKFFKLTQESLGLYYKDLQANASPLQQTIFPGLAEILVLVSPVRTCLSGWFYVVKEKRITFAGLYFITQRGCADGDMPLLKIGLMNTDLHLLLCEQIFRAQCVHLAYITLHSQITWGLEGTRLRDGGKQS